MRLRSIVGQILRRVAGIMVAACVVLTPMLANARPASEPIAAYNGPWRPVSVSPAPSTAIPIIADPAVPRAIRQPVRIQPDAPVRVLPVTPASADGLIGKASWFCSVEKPVCHRDWPPGSMVAAACSSLRAAMGRDWRGQTVTVTRVDGRYEPIIVTLVDYCASTDKTIDLYWAPMSQLGGTGVLDVTIRWGDP